MLLKVWRLTGWLGERFYNSTGRPDDITFTSGRNHLKQEWRSLPFFGVRGFPFEKSATPPPNTGGHMG